jgi:hypothetical protein
LLLLLLLLLLPLLPPPPLLLLLLQSMFNDKSMLQYGFLQVRAQQRLHTCWRLYLTAAGWSLL